MNAQDRGNKTPLAWECEVSLLTHPAIVGTLARLWIITGALVLALTGAIIALNEGIRAVAPLAAMIGLTVGALFLLSLVVMAVVLGNRMRMGFVIDERGISATVIDRRAKVANRLAAVLGVFAQRPGAAGAGLIAIADETRTVAWSAIAEARYDAKRCTITLRNRWRPVLHVFCTPATYEGAAARVAAAIGRAERPAHPRGNPLWRALGLSALLVLGLLPLFALPYPFEPDLFAVIFTLCFALATVWLVPLMAWAVLGGVGWIVAVTAMRGLEQKTNQFTGAAYTAFGRLDGSEIAALAVAAIGLALVAGIAVAALRGRITSVLMQDALEA